MISSTFLLRYAESIAVADGKNAGSTKNTAVLISLGCLIGRLNV